MPELTCQNPLGRLIVRDSDGKIVSLRWGGDTDGDTARLVETALSPSN